MLSRTRGGKEKDWKVTLNSPEMLRLDIENRRLIARIARLESALRTIEEVFICSKAVDIAREALKRDDKGGAKP